MIGFEALIVSLLMVIKFIDADVDENTSIAVEDSSNRQNSAELGHSFFRSMQITPDQPGTRRIFGGSAAELQQYPAVCALMDPNLSVRCTGTVIAPHWVLTAAHCVSPQLAYVMYNTRRPRWRDDSSATIQYMYMHPSYRVVQVSRSGGMDVTELHHDVGLVRTHQQLQLAQAPSVLDQLHTYNPFDLLKKDVQVLGFGRTDRSALGEELYGMDLQLTGCGRSEWLICVCGRAAGADGRGVCSGDSGGPVLYRGVLVGLTSMGPLECAQSVGVPRAGLTSVFTAVYQYSDLINNTIHNTESKIRMRRISHAPPARLPSPRLVLALLVWICVPWI